MFGKSLQDFFFFFSALGRNCSENTIDIAWIERSRANAPARYAHTKRKSPSSSERKLNVIADSDARVPEIWSRVVAWPKWMCARALALSLNIVDLWEFYVSCYACFEPISTAHTLPNASHTHTSQTLIFLPYDWTPSMHSERNNSRCVRNEHFFLHFHILSATNCW